MRILTVNVSEEYNNENIKTLLKRELKLSTGLIKSIKWRDNAILLNGEQRHVNEIVHTGDILTVNVTDCSLPSNHIIPVNYPLTILYEDEDLLVIDKPAGISVHSASLTEETITIAGAVCYYLNASTFHPVNRLDKGVTGIMVIAKSGYIHQRLMKILHTDSFRREYLGICDYKPQPESGEISLPIGRDNSSIIKRIISDDGLPSKTIYHTIKSSNSRYLVRLQPITGRTHQLRLHMASIGSPLTGDWLYGNENRELISRPALHSHELWLEHPMRHDTIHLLAPLPNDMKKLLEV